MCGIFFSLINDGDESSNCQFENIDFSLLRKRGPDSFKTLALKLPHKPPSSTFTLLFAASVLSLRGNSHSQITVQPLECPESGNILLWNGEIFSSGELFTVNDHENDGLKLFQFLNANSQVDNVENEEDRLFKAFESIGGPYAFVYYVRRTETIYFGRDRFGRRSLLVSASNNSNNRPYLTLSSVKVKSESEQDFQELKANGIYKAKLLDDNRLEITWHAWNSSHDLDVNYIKNIELVISEKCLNDHISPFNDAITHSSVSEEEMEKISRELYENLKESVSRRVRNIPNYCKACSKANEHIKFDYNEGRNPSSCPHAKLAILFSGGIDSAVLAALADQCLPISEPIDLLNVAFEMQNQIGQKRFQVPDRITGLECLKELNPSRKWNFVQIDISLEELRRERDAVIKHLLYPHQSVLDDSIGCALWFASRGRGHLYNPSDDKVEEYTSQAEVLLLGMGADEQLAGYARHRGRYQNQGLTGLCAEMKMEMERISERNLGRDDRILSDHGKESRLPYLDEHLVVSFLNRLECVQKCDMSKPRGVGEKYLLRFVGEKLLGLKYSARLEKRAIQFGSRVARAENSKEKGSDLCQRIIE